MRSAVSRRVVLCVLTLSVVAGGASFASRGVYLVIAQVELARLNEELGTDSTLDQDTLSPANWQQTQVFLDAVREAHLAGAITQPTKTTSQLASAN